VLLKNLNAVINIDKASQQSKKSVPRSLSTGSIHRLATAQSIKSSQKGVTFDQFSLGSRVATETDLKVRAVATKLLKQYDTSKKFDR
jgi:riboflavin synthase alpha subunit